MIKLKKTLLEHNINNLLNKKHRLLLIKPLNFHMVTATDTICYLSINLEYDRGKIHVTV